MDETLHIWGRGHLNYVITFHLNVLRTSPQGAHRSVVITYWRSILLSQSIYLMRKSMTLLLYTFYKACGCHRGVEASLLKIVGREFEVQSRDFVHFQTKTLRNCINSFISPSVGQIEPLFFHTSQLG